MTLQLRSSWTVANERTTTPIEPDRRATCCLRGEGWKLAETDFNVAFAQMLQHERLLSSVQISHSHVRCDTSQISASRKQSQSYPSNFTTRRHRCRGNAIKVCRIRCLHLEQKTCAAALSSGAHVVGVATVLPPTFRMTIPRPCSARNVEAGCDPIATLQLLERTRRHSTQQRTKELV
jgi:hypothetical protein